MKKLALALLAVCILAAPVFADTTGNADYKVKGNQAFENYLNKQDIILHNHGFDVSKEKSIQREVGLDLVIYDNDLIELSSENRYNLETSVTTLGSVVKVKKSLFSIIKGLVKKDE